MSQLKASMLVREVFDAAEDSGTWQLRCMGDLCQGTESARAGALIVRIGVWGTLLSGNIGTTRRVPED